MQENQSFWEHLEELRLRIIIVVAVWVLGAGAAFPLSAFFIEYISRSVEPLVFLSPAEPLMIRIRLSLWAGAVISIPVVVYEAGIFLWPALRRTQRIGLLMIAFLSFISCAAAWAFADYVLIPISVSFLLRYGQPVMQPMITAAAYIAFYVSIVLASCAIFHVPLVLGGMSLLGLVNYGTLTYFRRHVIVACFCVSAALTPPDVVTQIVVALPLYAIYEISIVAIGLLNARMKKRTHE